MEMNKKMHSTGKLCLSVCVELRSHQIILVYHTPRGTGCVHQRRAQTIRNITPNNVKKVRKELTIIPPLRFQEFQWGVNGGQKEIDIKLTQCVHFWELSLTNDTVVSIKKFIWDYLPVLTGFCVNFLLAYYTHLEDIKYIVPESCYHFTCYEIQTTVFDVFFTMLGFLLIMGLTMYIAKKFIELMYPDHKTQ